MAVSQQRRSDGYYTVSGYFPWGHDAMSDGVGLLRLDTGNHYDDELKSLVSYGGAPFQKFDYLSGTTEFFDPVCTRDLSLSIL